MEVKLEVLLSSSIKRKKPWPRFSWLGQEKESVFLLDDKRISEINLVSGRTKKKTPKLQSLLKNVVTMTASKNECSVRLCLLVSGDGKRVLLASPTGQTFLWERTENRDLAAVPGPAVIGRWSQIEPVETVILPTTADKENVVHGIFIKEETLGDCCFCSFVFTSEEKLVVTILNLQWYENAERHYSSVPYNVQWVTRKYPLASLVPKCDSVKSRGALVTAFSGDGLLLAIAVNQKDAKASQVLFVSTLNFITISSSLKGCGSKDLSVPSKYVRSYWVGDMSWTPDNLYLACMLKRGSLLFVTRLGDLLTLTTFGCSVEFGPAEFIPLHPLITYRPPQSVLLSHDSQHSVSSCASVNDLMRQRFSVTSHTRLPYLIVSDGYMVTVLRVSSNSSPSAFINSILVDTTQRLEKARCTLLAAQPKERSRLQFMSSLKVSTQQEARCKDSTLATIPRFLLEDEPTGLYGKTADSQRGEDESDDGSPFPSESAVDGGRLEFASMFDTIHAKPDSAADTCDTFAEMGRVQRNLLTAWSVAVSLGRVEQKDLLLRHTIRCFVRFAHLIQFMDCPLPASIKTFGDRALKRAVKKDPWIYRVLRLFKHFLTALYWDMAHSQCFGLTVELTKEVVQLILFPQNDWASSQSLSGCLFVLKLTSRYLNTIYTPRGGFHLLASQQGADNVSDSFAVPFLQDQGHIQKLFAFSLPSSQTVGHNQQPSNRLVEVWKMLYHQTLLYQASLHRQAVQQGSHPADQTLQHEESWTTYLLAQIQAALQAAGQTLGKSRKLNSVADGKRACFLQTRYYLAILYSHLYHYNLSAAQGLCDHLAREVLRRSQLYSDDIETFTVDECHVPETWLIKDVHSEAACAVIQSMARFMAAYFTNQPLYVLPPHNVDILPPLQSKPDALPRVIPLQHSLIASIVRDQHLSAVWTVEYALDLLLIGGLVPEAAWLAHRLGDWKMAVSLSLAYNLYCQSNLNLSGLKWRELHLPSDLHPTQIFQDKLQSLLGRQADPEEPDKSPNTVPKNYKQFTDSIEEEDADLLFSSVQEILKAAVMADADILSETFDLLMQTAKDLTAKLSGLVPDGLYLPAPPLYCPQPALDTEASSVDVALTAELVSRQRVSGVLQRVLLLFRAARCSLPSAQWYIQKLKHSRKIMNKIRLKGSQPQLNSFPDSLLKYASRRGFFKPGPSGDQQSDPVSIRAISTFRELCSLCWMFHVRERLSASCRKYQLARNSARDPEGYVGAVEYDAGVAEHCLDALEWAYRLLPFARFMNAEEITQDVILSLVGELPPIRKVAEVLVKVFPEQEDSVRVPLREKYNCLLQRLRHSTVKGPERDEMMSVVIQDLLKQRCKQLKRIARNIGPVEFHIWERAEEGVAENDNPLCDRFSLGTSLSQSTLTDFGRPQVYSDDTADTISEQLQGEDSRDEVEINQRHSKPQSMELMPDKKKVSDKPNRKLKLNAEKVEGHVLDPLALPVVGSWEFECDDDEYVRFLELFLSYMLEKGLVNNQDPGIPFLACFSSHLREHELNSLLFDVHTTLKRRQNQKGSSNIFRAGSCYHLVLGPHPAPLGKPVSVHSETWSAQSSQRPSSSMADPSETNLNANKYFPGAHKGKQKGLFGLRRQPSSPPRQDGSPESMPTPRSVSLYSQSTCDPLCSTPRTPQTEAYIYKALLPKDVDPPVDELTPELQSRFRLTGRLLEWMIRWSDRRLLCGPSKAQRLLEYSTVIRVKASAPAILSSLWMLERRYSAGLLVDKHLHSRVPEREYIVAPVFQQEHRSKVERESSVDTGYPASAETPITLLDQEIFESQHGYDSEAEGTNAKSGLPNSVSADMAAAETSSPVTGGDPCPAFCVQFHTPDPTPGLSATTVPIETGEPQRRDPNTQPLANSEAVRQMLQDEMFRLVQLQQINFMSLMQVVGSSFMNLPNVQQNLQEAQSNQMNGNQPLNRINERPRQSTGVQHREPVLCNQQQSSLEKHTGSSKNLNADDQSNKENIAQNPPPLILHLDPPQSQPESEGLIPASHGLLTSSPNKHRVQLLVPPSDSHQTPTLIPLEKTSGRAKGLQLLKLQPPDQFKLAAPSVKPFNPLPRGSAQFLPQPREAWAPSSLSSQPENNPRIHPHWKRSGPPSHLNLSQYDPEALRRAEEEKARWAEKVAKGPPRHLNLEQYEGNPAPEAQHWVPSGSPKRRGTGAQPLVPPPPLHTFPCLGLPLLRLQPAVYQLSSACMIPPLQTASQTAPGRPLPTGCAAPLHCPSLQMLQANHPPISKVLPQTLPFRPPKLIPVQELLAFEQSRLKHGFEEAPLGHLQLLKADIKPFERKTGQDSLKRQKRRIEKRQEGKKATVTFRPENSIILPKEKEVTEPSRSQLGEGFVIPPGEYQCYKGSFDSVLADQALIAGPIPTSAELHCLASTKKKPADIQDASTNTEPAARQIPSRIPPLLPPDVFLNLRFPKESSQEPLPTSSSDPAIEQDISGRRFINVIDIDAGDLLKDLPSSEAASVSTPESRAKLLSNAELHHMAASVTNAVHPDSFQREREIAYTPAIHHETPEKQPLSQAEIREPKPVGDEVTQRLLLDNDYSVQSPSLPGNRSSAKHKFTAKLSEMDVQLTALQNIAENMELEFANTRLLVNTIENLGAVIDPELEPERYTTRGVAVTEEDFDIMPREAHVSTEDVLDLTGLSDIADILGDLVKDGGISATELGLSEMQARRLPSTGKARGRGPGQAPTRTEKERWEIREWMKRKQQQRLAEYRKQRERSPFKEGTATINLTSKDIKVNNKIKEEKKKMVLSEHNSQRAMEALNLMNEMLSDTVPLPTAELSALADTPLKSVRSQGQRSARGGRPVSRSQSAGHTARSPSNVGQTRSLSYSPGRPSQYTGSVRTGALQKKPSAATGRASSARTSLGLHRPASALPRDRMSQITRRGMLTDLSSWKSKSQTSEKDRQDPRRNGSASHSQGSRMLSSAGPGRPSPYPRARSTRVETEAWPERDVVSPWSPPAEIRRLLEMDVSVQDPLLDEDGSLLRRGDLDGLDCLSESTGSILSKLDWAAIENMLASEEDL
ncbi:hypothetical protein EOD39_10435 [Acipenser ruthenus]|uniref:Protein JBTS17 n=1 Tax=Acipenser ruthenus TaxID=7906 RepID=A0A662YTT8_ACIRT|nr:hypothetical protein EOD39_10435 [Acipenser ruthenus]